jgi:serine/threonine-protein kinase
MADNEALGETLVDSGVGPSDRAAKVIGLTMRSTVLPQPDAPSTRPASDLPRYEPIKLLGRGGVGEVTLARDNDIHRPVAVKRLRPEVAAEGIHRFVHEIRTVGQLEHPNIAPIHDVGIDDGGNHYFVMRYVEGETLEAIIAKLAAGDADYHRRFSFEHRVQMFLGVANAVRFAHSKGIIHRDLKPSNIMVGPYGEVMLMDWGIAKKLGQSDAAQPVGIASTLDGRDAVFHTRHGTLVGTPAYMSPEQAAGHIDRVDARSDIYSLCVVFYELLALQHYLPGRTTVQEMLAAVQKDPQTHATRVGNPHQPRVPVELGWFLEKGLAKDPAARYQSLDELVDELQGALSGGFHVRCKVSFIKKAASKAVRSIEGHPDVVIAAVVLVLAAAGFGVVELVRLLAS